MITSEIDKYIIGRIEPQIYAFSTETVPNYLKVGDTYRPVEQRLKEWKKYFPDLKEHLEAVAKVDNETYFRDYAIHFYLEHDLAKHRLMPTEIKGLPYYSREFFKETSVVDVTQAIADIMLDFALNKGKYQFYTFDERPTAITYTYKRGDKELPLRPNQEETVKNFTTAVNGGRTNLLMYAVMRFGKTFTALSCAKTDLRFKAILVVSGKADVKEAWKKTTESIKNFEGFDFIDSDALARNNNVVDETIKKGHRAVVFLTLQDLSGGQIKEKHKHIFERQWNLLIIDETHYGARAEEYGKVLLLDKKKKKEIETESKYAETAEDYDNNEDMKRLHADIRLHLSGTPYRILMGSEFKKEDIIAFYQFSDIVRDKDAWDAGHLNEDDCNEWDNPYFGFPQMIRFAFNVNESSMKKMEEMKKSGNVIDNNDDNKRIAKNVGISNDILRVIQSETNTFILRDLDYKISHISQLSHDTSVEPTEKAERAMRQFGKLSDSEIITPSWMADEMVGFLPEEKIKQGTRILDIAAKEGEFAIALYKKYGDKVKNSVYSLPTSPLTYEFTRKVYTFLDMPVENIMRDYTSFDLIRIETKDKFMNIIKAEINPTVIIGNPPYQDTAVGEQKTFNGPIYNLFIDSVYPISNTVELIHPARFLSNAGGTPKAWNRKILEDSHFRVLLYKENVQDVFEGLQLTGGIAVSMHENDKSNEPIGQFIPFPELKCIGQTVTQSEKFEPLSNIAVSRTAYRFTDLMHKEHPEALSQLSNGHPYDVSTNIFARLPQIFYEAKPNDGKNYIQILGRLKGKRTIRYVRRDYIRKVVNLDSYKIFLSKADGAAGQIGNPVPARIIGEPEIGEPGVGNTESFISIGCFKSMFEAEALVKYVKTKFVRALLGILKTTQDITPEKWAYVPLQNFTAISDIDWNLPVDEIDNLLFRKYNLTATEQNFIRTKVKKMG